MSRNPLSSAVTEKEKENGEGFGSQICREVVLNASSEAIYELGSRKCGEGFSFFTQRFTLPYQLHTCSATAETFRRLKRSPGTLRCDDLISNYTLSYILSHTISILTLTHPLIHPVIYPVTHTLITTLSLSPYTLSPYTHPLSHPLTPLHAAGALFTHTPLTSNHPLHSMHPLSPPLSAPCCILLQVLSSPNDRSKPM